MCPAPGIPKPWESMTVAKSWDTRTSPNPPPCSCSVPAWSRLDGGDGSKRRNLRSHRVITDGGSSTGAAVFICLSNGMMLNQEHVTRGWCWWYRRYPPGDTVLEGLENDAREAKKGLWADPAPIPPWVYRKARRGQSIDESDLVPLSNETE
jgi:hypothetical protein